MNIKNKIQRYVRVLKITKKPTKEEFFASSKVTGLGLLLIGAVGFVIFFIAYLSGIFD
ncbi:MAG: protein translocase SEC61 complex subunit gamma [Candidatus Aenigmarchaeota archaeon]|nr:protein translocase SEC61 complex subunit gamma [Candidatus Aenigmarchaeota archaeon]